ncbi:MAG: type III pantothenate kinase [Bacteroidales bacterium]|nr:type III pantothenate kinase [Bacteroidales bacterium]
MRNLNLTIDIGNTRTKMGVFENNQIIEEYSFLNQNPDLGIQFIENHQGIESSIISSVSESEKSFLELLNKKISGRFFRSSNSRTPYKSL